MIYLFFDVLVLWSILYVHIYFVAYDLPTCFVFKFCRCPVTVHDFSFPFSFYFWVVSSCLDTIIFTQHHQAFSNWEQRRQKNRRKTKTWKDKTKEDFGRMFSLFVGSLLGSDLQVVCVWCVVFLVAFSCLLSFGGVGSPSWLTQSKLPFQQKNFPITQRTSLRFCNSLGAQNVFGKPDLESLLCCAERAKTPRPPTTSQHKKIADMHWGRPVDPSKPACKPTQKPPHTRPRKLPCKPSRKPPCKPPRKLSRKPPRKRPVSPHRRKKKKRFFGDNNLLTFCSAGLLNRTPS